MSNLVVALVLVAALAHASWNALLKGKRGNPLAATTGLCLTWFVIGAPLMGVVEPPGVESYGHLALSVGVHCVYFGLLAKAYGIADLSLIYPIARGLPPLLVALVAWCVAADPPSPGGMVGVGLVTLGVLTIGFARFRTRDASQRAGRDKALAVALLIALFIATYTVVDGLGVRVCGSPVGYAVWLTTIQGGVFGLTTLAMGGPKVRREVWRVRHSAVLAGALSAGGYGVALWAMSVAPIALVAALRETSVVFGVLIGVLLLKEPLGRARIAAACVVVAGVIAIELSA